MLLLCYNHVVTLFYSKWQQTSLWFERSEVLLTITLSALKVIGIVILLCDIFQLFTYVYLQYPRLALPRKGWKQSILVHTFPLQIQLRSCSMNHLKLLALNCRLTIVAFIKKHAHLDQ